MIGLDNFPNKIGSLATRSRHVPQRSCCACQAKKARPALLRLVRQQSGEFVIDLRQNLPGRGAYICPTLACVTALVRAKGLNRSFRQVVPDCFYDSLLRFFNKTNNSG